MKKDVSISLGTVPSRKMPGKVLNEYQEVGCREGSIRFGVREIWVWNPRSVIHELSTFY